jgi:hypothetical protein
MRAVTGPVPVDDDRVAEFQVTFFPAAARESDGARAFTSPIRDVAFVVDDFEIEIGVRIRPFDARDFSDGFEPSNSAAKE